MLEIRAGADAVLVGRITLETERTLLDLPDAQLQAKRMERGLPPCPLRVLVSNSGRFDPALPFFAADFSPIVLFSTRRMPRATAVALAGKAHLYLADTPVVDLAEMLETLRTEWAVRRLLCEGGPALFRSLLERDLVDEINVTFCPWIFGGDTAPTLTECAGAFLSESREFRMDSCETVAEECFVRYRKHGHPKP